MEDWITLTAEDLPTYLLAAQVRLLRTVEGSKMDPIPALLQDVIGRIRADISASGKWPLSANASTIPAELRGAACALILEALQGRIPALRLTDDQKRSADQARELLRRIAKGEQPVSRPHKMAQVSEFMAGGGLRCVQARAHRTTAEALGGL